MLHTCSHEPYVVLVSLGMPLGANGHHVHMAVVVSSAGSTVRRDTTPQQPAIINSAATWAVSDVMQLFCSNGMHAQVMADFETYQVLAVIYL